MEFLNSWALSLFGGIMGVIGFYFIRPYEKFDAKSLGLTVAAFIGGDVISIFTAKGFREYFIDK